MEKDTRILIAGDFVPSGRVKPLFQLGNFDEVLSDVRGVAAASDFSIVNLECPVCDDIISPIIKTGPNLRCDNNVLDALLYAEFDCVTLANNHIKDFGAEGVIQTLKNLDDKKILHVGCGKNLLESERPLYKKINDLSFAIINVCEHEWSIATENEPGAAPLDPLTLYSQIKTAKQEAQYVIVIVHGGTELYPLPTPRMKRTYRYLIDCGADVVVNHHQHVFSGYEMYKNRPIVYGLGNLCFDNPKRRNEGWNEGYMIELSFKYDNSINFKLIPYIQCNNYPKVELLLNTDKFEKRISGYNETIIDDNKLYASYKALTTARTKEIRGLFEPYANRYLSYVIRKLGGPYLRSPKSYLYLLANLQCESHNDIIMSVLKDIVTQNIKK